MFSIISILLHIVISNCVAQAETPLFSSPDAYDSYIFSDFSPSTNPEDLQATLQQTDLTNPTTLAFLDENDDQNDDFSLFADSHESCSLETSQLTSTLSRRGGGARQCDTPQRNSGLNAPTIDPKVAPFIDLQTMELRAICPSQYKSPYSIAVCSSGVIGDIVAYPPDAINFDLYWAQIITIGVLVSCINPRYIFCCREWHDGIYENSLGALIPDKGQGRFCQLLDPFDYFYLLAQVRFEYP